MDILLGALTIVLAINALGYLQQPSMVFFPSRELQASPADWGMSFEEVSLRSADGPRLHGWYLPAPGADKVLLFFHGNAGNISHRADSLAIFHGLGLNVFIFDYRGYGRSEGRPSEAGVYADGRAAWDYLRHSRGFAAQQIIVFGRSLGGVPATRLAAQEQPGALILESTLSSARDFAREAFPLLSHLMLMRYEFDNARWIARVRCPLLVLHSPHDEIMPYALGRRLYEAASAPKRFVELVGDHNSGFLLSQPRYAQALQHFIAALNGGDLQ